MAKPGAVLEFAPLLARAQEGCGTSIAAIYRAFHPKLLRYLRFQEPSEAEDIAATTWMIIAKTLVSFEGDERAFLAWMFTIAKRRLSDHRRMQARRQTAPVASLEDVAPPSRTCHEADTASNDAVRRALDALTPEQAEVVALRLVCDLSVEDVAELVGRTPEAVRAMQHRALRRLSAVLRSSSEAVTA